MESLTDDTVQRMAQQMEEAVFGRTQTTPQEQSALTFDKLMAIHDYLKPEKLSVAGEELEIYGFNVHTAFCPSGITVLTEKHSPSEVMPKRGKLVIINENEGTALIYDPDKR